MSEIPPGYAWPLKMLPKEPPKISSIMNYTLTLLQIQSRYGVRSAKDLIPLIEDRGIETSLVEKLAQAYNSMPEEKRLEDSYVKAFMKDERFMRIINNSGEH